MTGTLQEMAVRESPVRIDVLPTRFLEMVPSSNVMDAIERVNGLYQQIDCGVCYTNNIRINGIDGPNTAVLIDGGTMIDYSVRLTGPMHLPEYPAEVKSRYEAATGASLYSESPTYTVHNLQITHDFKLKRGELLQAYAAVENLLDFKQSSPLVGYYDGVPGFADSFDTAYIYGPIAGRHFGIGFRLMMP